MSGTIRIRFAVAYALMGAVAAFIVFASVTAVVDHGVKASKHSVSAANARTSALAQKLAATKSGAVKVACAQVAQTASQQGIIMKSCVLRDGKKSYQVKGDVGTVVVKATDGTADYLIQVTLNKGAWVAGNIHVVGASKHKATQ
jgi:hypothetical protein